MENGTFTYYKNHLIVKRAGWYKALNIYFRKLSRAKQEIDKEEAGNE